MSVEPPGVNGTTTRTGFAGQSVTQFRLSVANLNTTAVTARPRIRFFLPDGTGHRASARVMASTS